MKVPPRPKMSVQRRARATFVHRQNLNKGRKRTRQCLRTSCGRLLLGSALRSCRVLPGSGVRVVSVCGLSVCSCRLAVPHSFARYSMLSTALLHVPRLQWHVACDSVIGGCIKRVSPLPVQSTGGLSILGHQRTSDLPESACPSISDIGCLDQASWQVSAQPSPCRLRSPHLQHQRQGEQFRKYLQPAINLRYPCWCCTRCLVR